MYYYRSCTPIKKFGKTVFGKNQPETRSQLKSCRVGRTPLLSVEH